VPSEVLFHKLDLTDTVRVEYLLLLEAVALRGPFNVMRAITDTTRPIFLD
jgi:hypothetical protein